MVYSANPNNLGKYKQSMGVFAYEVGRKYRILYSVRHDDGVIDLHIVGDHKTVYGKD